MMTIIHRWGFFFTMSTVFLTESIHLFEDDKGRILYKYDRQLQTSGTESDTVRSDGAGNFKNTQYGLKTESKVPERVLEAFEENIHMDELLTSLQNHPETSDNLNIWHTLKTLRRHLKGVQLIRSDQMMRDNIAKNNRDKLDTLHSQALLVSEANLHLLAAMADPKGNESYRMNRETKESEKNLSPAENISESARTAYGCGSSSAIGIFNLLTFLVYGFGLLASLLTSTSLGNLFSNIVNTNNINNNNNNNSNNTNTNTNTNTNMNGRALYGRWEYLAEKLPVDHMDMTKRSTTKLTSDNLKPVYTKMENNLGKDFDFGFLKDGSISHHGPTNQFSYYIESSIGAGFLIALLQLSNTNLNFSSFCSKDFPSLGHQVFLKVIDESIR